MLHLAGCTVLCGIPGLTGYSAGRVAISAVLTYNLPKRHSQLHVSLKTLMVDMMADKNDFSVISTSFLGISSNYNSSTFFMSRHFGWQFLLISHKDKQFPRIVISCHHVFAADTSLF